MTRLLVMLVVAAGLACEAGTAPQPVVPSATSAAGAGGAACPRAKPTACATKPTLAADAAPILERHCYRCHAPGASSFAVEDHNFSDQSVVRAQRARVLAKVAACVMPPDKPESITPEEAATLMAWAACGD
jgi:uncharacterized membrane protein